MVRNTAEAWTGTTFKNWFGAGVAELAVLNMYY
jgi:hypothetical protein